MAAVATIEGAAERHKKVKIKTSRDELTQASSPEVSLDIFVSGLPIGKLPPTL